MSQTNEIVAKVVEALDSAARTAHAHNKSFCHGDFETCRNCRDWMELVLKARTPTNKAIADATATVIDTARSWLTSGCSAASDEVCAEAHRLAIVRLEETEATLATQENAK